MINNGFTIGYAIAYGTFVSILLLFYILYSRILLNHISHQFGKLVDFKILHFFVLVVIFTISSYFFGPLNLFGAFLISTTISTSAIFTLYFYSSHPEVPTLSKLNLAVLWILHAIPLYLILFFHNKMFQYIMVLTEVNL
jgi:O-antigen/teichoic acid export membrane protein